MNKNHLYKALTDLVDLVARLRSPGGCPWDARQTFRSVRMYLLEEAYETLDAIEREQPSEISQELGDLLFQILFLAQMGAEKGEFDLLKVMEGIYEKMVRRHPHVFGSATVESAEEVALSWARIKEREKADEGRGASPFDTIPNALPALLRAHRLGERATKAGLLRSDPDELRGRILGGLDTLERLDRGEEDELARVIVGDLLFDLANLARMRGFNAEDLLRGANQRFQDRSLRAPGEGEEG